MTTHLAANTPIVQLANISDIPAIFTALDSPIWRAKLWVNPYERHLPFMAEEDTRYNARAVALENLIIDFMEYLRLDDYEAMRATDRSWMLDPSDASILYVHFEFSNPPFFFASFRHGLLHGFSRGSPVTLGELKTYPLLLDVPEVEDTSDHFTYQRMRFASGSVSIDNSAGVFDDMLEMFGNDLILFNCAKDGKLDLVRTFFIEKYEIGLTEAEFSVKDKRSRLTFRAPNTFYDREAYPFIEENLLGQAIRGAYGYCRGVPGTCLNRNQIYNPPQFVPANGFNNWFRFKFARTITEIGQVMVNMQDVWVEVFPGLGVPPTDSNPGTDYRTANPHPIRVISKDALGNDLPVAVTRDNMNDLPENGGAIEIWWSQAMRDNPGFLERRNGNAQPVKMTGVFVDRNTPGEIVRDIMSFYGELPYEASYFNLESWELEMAGGPRIGLCLDRQRDIFEWIEQIQNGSLFGFQLLVHKNLFSARVDNANRMESFSLHWSEIANRDQLKLELDGELYASYTEINYLQDYTLREWLTVRDMSQREGILEAYHFDKGFHSDAFLVDEEDVVRKGRMVLENFMQVRPVIRGIELGGLRGEMQLFATGFIDFALPLPRQMRRIQRYMGGRETLGRVRVKVIGRRLDVKNGRTHIDVVQCDRLEAIG